MTTARERIEAKVAEVQAEMCCIEHPVFKVLCLRKIGHPGLHWFMARWGDRRETIEQAVAALNALTE